MNLQGKGLVGKWPSQSRLELGGGNLENKYFHCKRSGGTLF